VSYIGVSEFVEEPGIKVDLDLYKKYDDTLTEKNVIYIRNDYFLYDKEASVKYHKVVSPFFTAYITKYLFIPTLPFQ
jgi:hypothetical protein